ncbi:hypothetical protein BJY01DRAFT_178756 [Aspergillus pseudoustus]|uniref:Uncharacterized protein n=1 Tax=Aspergillus pseudoustus TaxID=1810923 RepID=A0ABR4KVU3_9EURO
MSLIDPQNRKHKHESPITPQSQRFKEEPDPPRPQPRTQTSETFSSGSHIYHAEAQDPAQTSDGPQGSPLGPEPTGTTNPKLEDTIPPEERPNSFIGPTASPGGEILKLSLPQEDSIAALSDSLVEQQKDVSAKRLKVRESRTALRHNRDEVSKLRSKFMARLDSVFARLDHADLELLQGYEQLQKATQDHMRMESSYHQEEDQLEAEEYMLTLNMESFAALSGSGSSPNVPNRPRKARPVGHTARRELPRCIVSYLRRIADERMLQESLSELESEWFITLERQHEGYHFLDEDSEFLRTFEQQRNDIWKDLTNAQLDVNSLRIVCLDQGYTNFEYEDLSSLNLFQYDGEQILDMDQDPLKLAPEEQFHYVSITETPNQDPDFFLDLDPETLEVPPSEQIHFIHGPDHNKSHKSAEFVNKWMLHKLRISSMGIWHLQDLPIWDPLRRKGWDDYDISQYVLDRWFYDDTALASLSSTSSYYGDGETMIAQAAKRKDRVKSRSLSPASRPARRPSLRRSSTFPSVSSPNLSRPK